MARLIVVVLVALYVAMAVGCSVFQRSLLYYPTHDRLDVMARAAATAGFERWTNRDGEVIGWKRITPGGNSGGELLITHGNGGAAFHRVDYARPLRDAARLDVYILEYPGFGARAGKPSQRSLFEAADEAFALLPKKSPVYLLGESLGTGVASYLAGTHSNEVAGVMLFAPYNTLDDVAQYHVRILPARWLMHDHFKSEEFLRTYRGPIAVIVGGNDTVIPAKFGRRLFDQYAGPKRFWEIPDAGHNTLQPRDATFWRELQVFLMRK